MPSFDVVSKVNRQEIDNAFNQAKKELTNRYDFRDSKSEITLETDHLLILADDNMKLKALQEILNQKMAKRGVGLKSLDYQEPEEALGGALRQKVMIKEGISTDEGRNIVKLIKEQKLKKIQAAIQGDQIRITGPKKDDLQEVMQLLREKVKLELQFVNFKD